MKSLNWDFLTWATASNMHHSEGERIWKAYFFFFLKLANILQTLSFHVYGEIKAANITKGFSTQTEN